MPYVEFIHGDILEGNYDLSALPTSSDGSLSVAARRKADICGIKLPPMIPHGHLSPLYPVNMQNPQTKYIVYCASGLSDHFLGTSFEIIKNISQQLGEITQHHQDISNVEVPLLGTGRGGLSDIVSAKALKEGFEETARDDARLTIFMFGTERLHRVMTFFWNPLAGKEYRIQAPQNLHNALAQYTTDVYGKKSAFIIMSFEKTSAHDRIVKVIKDTCAQHNIIALRADDKQYVDGLLDNILTYIYGCDFGIAVFERIRRDTHNPNVSFEAGYLTGLKKPLLYLKDETLSDLPTDLVGNLYKTFDFLNPESTLPEQIAIWLKDKGFV